MPVGAKIFDIAFTVFIYLVAVGILIGAILFAFSTRQDKSLFGYRYYTILTESMAPKYNEGDVIFVKVCGGDDIDVGDVITFNPSLSSDAYLTHRVTKKFVVKDEKGNSYTCFNTKGDANNVDDSFVIDESRVIGKVTWCVPKLGYIIRFVHLRWYFIVLIIIMIAVFFQLLKRYFLMGKDEEDDDSEKKKKSAENIASESESENKLSEDGNENKEPDEGADLLEETNDPETADQEGSESSVTDTAETVSEDSESGSENELPSEDKPNETSPQDE